MTPGCICQPCEIERREDSAGSTQSYSNPHDRNPPQGDREPPAVAPTAAGELSMVHE